MVPQAERRRRLAGRAAHAAKRHQIGISGRNVGDKLTNVFGATKQRIVSQNRTGLH